jgi:hypothetical protein
VNVRIQTLVKRLRTYLERIERDLATGDRTAALANLAELCEIGRRMWKQLAETPSAGRKNK